MADTLSPEWWRTRLLKKYVSDFDERSKFAAIYDSTNPPPSAPEGARDVYRRLLAMSRTPWGRLVVDIVAERMEMIDLRSADEPDTAKEMWTLMRRNRIEAVQRQVHREALALGTSYVSVARAPRIGARIAFESGLSVTHETSSGDPSQVLGACKVWYDNIESRIRINVYLPDATYRWVSAGKAEEEVWRSQISSDSLRWDPYEGSAVTGDTAGHRIDNPLGVVPIVPFVVRPSWDGYGTSDLEDLTPVLERLETLNSATLLAVELGAFRQRWATGVEIPVDENGNPKEPYHAALDRLWVSEDEQSRFGSFEATDISGYLQGISDAIGQLSAVSRIPTLYFAQSELSNPPSAASLEASETGLINRVYERRDPFSESWEVVAEMGNRLRSGSRSGGPLPASLPMFSVVWRDPRTRAEGQMIDAALKLHTMGVPFVNTMAYIGFTPEEIEDMQANRAADLFGRMALAMANSPQSIGSGGGESSGDESGGGVSGEPTDTGAPEQLANAAA